MMYDERSLLDYIMEADYENPEEENEFIKRISKDRLKELREEVSKEIILEYAEYIRNNLSKLNEQLSISKNIVSNNLTILYNKVEGLEKKDSKQFSVKKRFIIQAIKNTPGISIEGQSNGFLYIESLVNESAEFRELFVTPLIQVKDKVTTGLVTAIIERCQFSLLNDLERLSKDELKRTLRFLWSNKTFGQIYELLQEFTNVYGIKKEQMGLYITEFISEQDHLFQLTNLDKFISNYLEVKEFLEKSKNIINGVQRTHLNEKWQLNSYFNLRYKKPTYSKICRN
jgi:hypothetical protein